MRFELTVALKYLLPRWRQLSVSIISLISVLVISLVVWLVVLFLSVTEGIEKKWIEELVALNAPLRMTPTEAYYHSYFYEIDKMSAESDYSTKSIGEKLYAERSDPYDPLFDMELPENFPKPELKKDGSLIDPVKQGWEALLNLPFSGVRPVESEVSFGNLRLNLLREDSKSILNQVSYVASHDSENQQVKKMTFAPSSEDYHNLIDTLARKGELSTFFDETTLFKLRPRLGGLPLRNELLPEHFSLKGVALLENNQLLRVIIPHSTKQLSSLEREWRAKGFETKRVEAQPQMPLFLDHSTEFSATRVEPLSDALYFNLSGEVQGVRLEGTLPFTNLEIVEIPSLLDAKNLPTGGALGDGVLVAKALHDKGGVRLGDQGELLYYLPTASSVQEQRLPIFVAGFYDPGLLPVGSKLLFVDPSVTALLRDNTSVSDPMLGNAIQIWIKDIQQAPSAKKALIASLQERGVDPYWKVESYQDYEFARPVLQQLKSDKNLFTLIAIIILLVACSNIISMLIILVKDKKREIGILRSMGASSKRIALIFGLCGFALGSISCVIGTVAALLTLRHLQSLVDLLSFFQGHEAFQAAFYGSQLPNELSFNSLLFVVFATLIISLLAGVIPAIKAARIRPTEILRGE